MQTTDVLIIGAGVIGNSIAYHLARQGRDVLVVERGEIASEPVASWASAGGVRRQGRHPAEAALAREAIARWHHLDAELEADLHYRQGGQLLVAENEDEAERLLVFVREQHAMGFDDVRWVDRAEVRALVPDIGEQVVAGSYSPADGQADPPLTTRAFADAARRHGATYWTHTRVELLLLDDRRVIGARTSRVDVRANVVVLAAGAWSAELAASIGLHLPVEMHALQMVRSTLAPSVLTPVLSAVSRALSLKQLNDGAFLLGGGWRGEINPDRRGFRLREQNVEGNWAAACAILPAVARQRVERAWCGLEAMSADGIPFI
ncbi:MAG: FAD-binding oxidoreductase, partial [Chloroflexi bacterium]|nr:FAD-binding oxidoreductase [Chloroflexota bacterium]